MASRCMEIAYILFYTHTHTLTLGAPFIMRSSMGEMVFILYKLYFLFPYSNPTSKSSLPITENCNTSVICYYIIMILYIFLSS